MDVLNEKFKPIALNEENVTNIFNHCVSPYDVKDPRTFISVLFPFITGYGKEKEIQIYLNSEVLPEKAKDIKYLLGQLYTTHKGNNKLSFAEAMFSYKKKKWTENPQVTFKLLSLSAARPLVFTSVFYAKTNTCDLFLDEIHPTLSPDDPNFPAWWAEHKSEWE